MTRIVVFSDSHGSFRAVEAIWRANPDADLYVHLGDGYAQAQWLREENPLLPLLAVRGNCDGLVSDSDTKLCTLAGKRILLTHGHRQDVKMGLAQLRADARRQQADIVLFGHTHQQLCEETEGIYYVNPGNANAPTGIKFATVEIDEAGAVQVALRMLER